MMAALMYIAANEHFCL